ncbi:MAG TPA: RDD family protein [Alphaproteobacteria bacterium]|nr:RDD family protein [Alphaproteobacteria bacterium]
MSQLPISNANPSSWAGPAPDPLDHPELYEGIVFRRIFGHLIDLVLIILLIIVFWMIVMFLHVVSFGLLFLPLVVLSPAVTVFYDALQVGGRRSATIGMRTMGLEVRSWLGTRPTMSQAFVRAAVFWGMSYMTAAILMWLVLGFALFNTRRRCLHDYLSGTVVIRTSKSMVLGP